MLHPHSRIYFSQNAWTEQSTRAISVSRHRPPPSPINHHGVAGADHDDRQEAQLAPQQPLPARRTIRCHWQRRRCLTPLILPELQARRPRARLPRRNAVPPPLEPVPRRRGVPLQGTVSRRQTEDDVGDRPGPRVPLGGLRRHRGRRVPRFLRAPRRPRPPRPRLPARREDQGVLPLRRQGRPPARRGVPAVRRDAVPGAGDHRSRVRQEGIRVFSVVLLRAAHRRSRLGTGSSSRRRATRRSRSASRSATTTGLARTLTRPISGPPRQQRHRGPTTGPACARAWRHAFNEPAARGRGFFPLAPRRCRCSCRRRRRRWRNSTVCF
jgi:hypothetical protein